MTPPKEPSVADRIAVLRILFRLLSDPEGSTDEELVTAVAALSQLYATEPSRSTMPPPHAIAVSMANAVFAQPHMAVTFPRGEGARERPFVIHNEALAVALGIPSWELDDLREEVDRRAGGYLMQVRAVKWLRARFDKDREGHCALFRAMFPGSSVMRLREMRFVGARVYVALDNWSNPDPLSTYLGWARPGGSLAPPRFESRYVDVSMRRRMGMSIGGSDEQIRDLFDQMVLMVPSTQIDETARADRWRSEGWAHLTGLGRPPLASASYTLPLIAGQLDHATFFTQVDDKLGLRAVRASFDHLALPRMSGATRDMYAAMMAKVLADEPALSIRSIFDVRGNMKAVFEPMLTWASRPSTATHLARNMDTSVGAVKVLLHKVRSDWVSQSRGSWGGVPSEEQPDTVRGIIAAHLASTYGSLMELWAQPPDRFSHQTLMLLFTADHLQHAPLARLWLPQRGLLPSPEDIVGKWFWHCWQRILDARIEDEPLSEDQIPMRA